MPKNSILYHLWRCVGYDVLPGTSYGAEGTAFKVKPQAQLIKCPHCGSPNVVHKGSVNRRLRASQVGANKPVWLDVAVPIVECKKCRTRRQIDLKIADPMKRYTRAFANDVITLLREMSVLAVAAMYGVSWSTINSILHDWIEKKYPRRRFKGVFRIAIDETSIGKGHRYVTIVLDLDTGNPIFVGDGKAESALEPFWKLLGPKRAERIQCVAMDMGAAYQAAVRRHLPKAAIVFDHFHVVKLANDRLNQLRRHEVSAATQDGKKVITGSKYILLKNPENLVGDQSERLRALLLLNRPLNELYILKEDLRQLWDKGSKEEATAALDVFVATARGSEVKLIKSLGDSIDRYREGILNYYDHPVSSGPLEGLNNKVKALTRRAYGYRDMAFFKLLVYAINEFNPKKTKPILKI
jgi:transposase